MTDPVVGVIGGLGPEATVELMRRVIRLVPASDDQDHIRVLVDNNPKVPSRMKAVLENGENPAPELCSMARGLQSTGADFLVIPCNSAHFYYDDVARSVNIPVLDMLALARRRVPEQARRLGLLATTPILKTRLYERYFPEFDFLVPESQDQSDVMEIIFAIKRGELGQDLRQFATAKVRKLVDRGARMVILGCTELSIMSDYFHQIGLPVVDPLQVLAEAIVDIAKEEGNLRDHERHTLFTY